MDEAFTQPTFPLFVGQCIYCGNTVLLQDEHIVPLGLNGEWILRNASCRRCADITSAFELNVLRRALPLLRAKLDLKTRRKKERPHAFPLILRSAYGRTRLEVPISEHPGTVILPQFAPAATLSSAGYTKGIDIIGANTLHLEHDRLVRVAREHAATAVTVSIDYQPSAFARMIAKIGYGFGVACCGLEHVRSSPCLTSILGHSDDIGRWVGCGMDDPVNSTDGLHAVSLRQQDGRLLAYVRLFAQFGAPEYHVVLA